MTGEKPNPSRRAKIVAALLGALMLAVGSWLLWVFAEDPSGELTWLPGTWKGAPLILGACFFGVYGALLLSLRRFSLRGMLLCSIGSAALTGGLTAYVNTITSVASGRGYTDVPGYAQTEFVKIASEEVTSERIVAFLAALQKAGKIDRGPDFQTVSVIYSPAPDIDIVKWRVDFEYLTHVHPRRSKVREAVQDYLHIMLAIASVTSDLASSGQEFSPPASNEISLENYSFRIPGAISDTIMIHPDSLFSSRYETAIPFTEDESFDPYLGADPKEFPREYHGPIKLYNKQLQWLIEQEENHSFRKCMELAQRELLNTYRRAKLRSR